MKLDIKPLR